MRPSTTQTALTPLQRIRIWYALMLLVCAIFLVRLFYLQIIRHDYYQTAALAGQLKEYEIPPERGVIEAHNGGVTVPIVLNEMRYTLYADPVYVKDSQAAADALAGVLGGDANEYKAILQTKETRYVVLAKKLTNAQSKKVDDLKLKGVGTREVPYRTYPQGSLASQLLGFVNDDGEGKYGIEQALNNELKGQPGQLRAITDAAGVPLAANRDNIMTEARSGKRVVLTIDVGMQQQMEDILTAGVKRARSGSGSAVILDVRTGAVKAMANYPTYKPAEFFKVADGNLFNNAAVSAPLEVGSVMKPLTLAAALNLGVVRPNSSYHDPGFFKVDDATITNVEEAGGAGTKTVGDILQQSLNTGATWLLMQMGGGEINRQARERWHTYMTKHYQFGTPTGIEQGYEASGSVPHPTEGYGLNIQFANTAFGQGMTATPLQMAAALSSVVNGGTYYRPHLVEKTVDPSGKEHAKQPEAVRKGVVSPATSKHIRSLMEYAFSRNYMVYGMQGLRSEFSIGGKTGTAQIIKPGGTYYEDRFNGMFMGYVGGNQPQYAIVVRVNQPKIPGYAGSKAAGPIFVDLTNMLINNFGVTPKH